MATEASSDDEYHSAPEEEEGEGEKRQGGVGLEEEDKKLETQLESMNLSSEQANNDLDSSETKCVDGANVGETDIDAKMSGLDNRYVSEEHAPEKDGAVELTEEQIKVTCGTWSSRSPVRV